MTPKEPAAIRQAIEFIVDCEYGKAELALRGALAEQAEQEPVAWVREELQFGVPWNVYYASKCFDDLTPLYAAPVQQVTRADLKAAFKECFERAADLYAPKDVQEQAEQEPVLAKHQPCGCIVCTCEDEVQCQGCGGWHCGTHPIGEFPNPIYAAPVRTKDLTDDEIEAIMVEQGDLRTIAFARAVIAADREKNK